MEDSVEARVGSLLLARSLKLTAAESCTGGLIGHRLTNIPGSSAYYLGSITSYANQAKQRLLGVSSVTLAAHGAVSRQTVIEMARGVRSALAGDFPLEQIIGLSVSGIAGPGGALPGKPVGLVWVGLSAAGGDYAWRFLWQGDRIQNKELSANAALRLLEDYLRGAPPAQDEEG